MIISVEHISKSYNDNNVFSDYSLALDAGSRTAILGASGIGKTTLINLILGIAAPDSGRILIDENVAFSAVFQEDRLLEGTSIIDNLNIFPFPFRHKLAEEILLALELEREIFSHRTDSCSGGMKRRIAIARSLYACRICEPPSHPVLIMDEPFKGLDVSLKNKVIEYVGNTVSEAGVTLLIVTHEKEEAAALGCDLITL